MRTNSWLSLLLLSVVAWGGSLCAEPKPFPEAQGEWFHSAPEAWQASKANGKLVMLDFWYAGCGWCRVLTTETLNKDVVQTSLKQLNLGKINRDEGDNKTTICKKYNIQGYPTLVFTDAEGNEVDRIVGGKHVPEEFAKLIDSIVAKGGRYPWYEKQIAAEPGNIELRYERIQFAMNADRWDLVEADAAVFLEKSDARTEKRYAEVMMSGTQAKDRSNKSQAVVDDARRFLELFPQDEDVPMMKFLLGSNLSKLGRIDDAGEAYRDLVTNHSGAWCAVNTCMFFNAYPEQLRREMKTPPGAKSNRWADQQWKSAWEKFEKLNKDKPSAPDAPQGEDF